MATCASTTDGSPCYNVSRAHPTVIAVVYCMLLSWPLLYTSAATPLHQVINTCQTDLEGYARQPESEIREQ